MKKIIILTSLALFLLMGTGIYSQEPSPTPLISSNSKQYHAERIDNKGNNEIKNTKKSSSFDKISSTYPHPPETKGNTNNHDREAVTNWWIMCATIVLSIVAIIQAVAMFLQFFAMKKQDKTSRLRDRAFVYFLDPTITPYPPGNPNLWGIGINLMNNGNMPACKSSIKYSHVITTKSENVIDPWPLAQWSDAEVPSVIGPRQSLSLQGSEIAICTIRAAQKSEFDIFILIKAEYIDGFDLKNPRITEMSRVFRFDKYGGQSLGFAGPHNCTDDDCKKQ